MNDCLETWANRNVLEGLSYQSSCLWKEKASVCHSTSAGLVFDLSAFRHQGSQVTCV
jgi:hypothetical protein